MDVACLERGPMNVSKLVPAVFFLSTLCALPARVEAQSTSTSTLVARYVGHDGNWFNPTNWSTGRVPDAATDVVIGGGADVVIDPAQGASEVSVRDVWVIDGASLKSLPGTVIHTRNETVQGGGEIALRGSGSDGGTFIVGCARTTDCVGEPWSALSLNPSTQSHRDVILKTSVTAQLGLGGTTPASLEKTRAGTVLHAGAGHHATLEADTIALDGRLVLTLHYGFAPQPGDQFQIITARQRLSGQFIGLPEGAPVGCTSSNVGLYISYRGGDGNDVVLTARETPESTCLLLPAVQIPREAVRGAR